MTPEEAKAEEAELLGEVTVDTGRGPVVVRAHTWADGVRLCRESRALVDALLESRKPAQGEDPAQAQAEPLDHWRWMEGIAEHWDDYMRLLCAATGKDSDFLNSLSDADGLAVMEAYWSVNRSFFLRRVLWIVMSRSRRSRTSTPNSSPAGTAGRRFGTIRRDNSGATTQRP